MKQVWKKRKSMMQKTPKNIILIEKKNIFLIGLCKTWQKIKEGLKKKYFNLKKLREGVGTFRSRLQNYHKLKLKEKLILKTVKERGILMGK